MKRIKFDTTVMPGGTLRIPSEFSTQLQADQPVRVIVIPAKSKQSLDARRKGILESFGAWADDPSIPGIFEEIDRERHAYLGREVESP